MSRHVLAITAIYATVSAITQYDNTERVSDKVVKNDGRCPQKNELGCWGGKTNKTLTLLECRSKCTGNSQCSHYAQWVPPEIGKVASNACCIYTGLCRKFVGLAVGEHNAVYRLVRGKMTTTVAVTDAAGEGGGMPLGWISIVMLLPAFGGAAIICYRAKFHRGRNDASQPSEAEAQPSTSQAAQQPMAMIRVQPVAVVEQERHDSSAHRGRRGEYEVVPKEDYDSVGPMPHHPSDLTPPPPPAYSEQPVQGTNRIVIKSKPNQTLGC